MFSNIFGGLKDMVFEGGDTPAPAPATPANTAAQPIKAGSSVSFTPNQHVNQDMVAAIRKQTFSRNTALTNLIQASDALVDIIPDPVMRLKAAQKTNGGGRGAKELAEAVQIHLNDVDMAEAQFGQALDTKVKTEVGGLNTLAANAESQITQGHSEVQHLTNRIAEIQQTIAKQTTHLHEYRTQATAKESELRQAQVDFKAAAEAVRLELNGHKATILSTLG